MPPDFLANSSGTSQVVDLTSKAPMTSAPPVSSMTQNPQYSTTTTVRPVTGNTFRCQRSRCLMHQRIHCQRTIGL